MEAYNYAASQCLTDITLKLVGGYPVTRRFIRLIKDISVLIDGGYDCSFLNKYTSTGMPGSLTIAAGSVTISNVGVAGIAPLPAGRSQ